MGHQTEVKKLLTKEHAITLLSCLNTMQDRRGPKVEDERAFALAYLRAYEILTGFSLELTGEEVDQDNPKELGGN